MNFSAKIIKGVRCSRFSETENLAFIISKKHDNNFLTGIEMIWIALKSRVYNFPDDMKSWPTNKRNIEIHIEKKK